jgi:hypothetical protein
LSQSTPVYFTYRTRSDSLFAIYVFDVQDHF